MNNDFLFVDVDKITFFLTLPLVVGISALVVGGGSFCTVNQICVSYICSGTNKKTFLYKQRKHEYCTLVLRQFGKFYHIFHPRA